MTAGSGQTGRSDVTSGVTPEYGRISMLLQRDGLSPSAAPRLVLRGSGDIEAAITGNSNYLPVMVMKWILYVLHKYAEV